MSCRRNQQQAAKAAGKAGIPGRATSPQTKWADLDRAFLRAHPQAGTAELRREQAKRRAQVASIVKAFHQAIKQKQQVAVLYRSPAHVRKYRLIPLDVKGGLHPNSRHNRYMWGYSQKANLPLCLRLDRVLKVEALAATFEPAELAKTWQGKQVTWNLPRDWLETNGRDGRPKPTRVQRKNAGRPPSREKRLEKSRPGKGRSGELPTKRHQAQPRRA